MYHVAIDNVQQLTSMRKRDISPYTNIYKSVLLSNFPHNGNLKIQLTE